MDLPKTFLLALMAASLALAAAPGRVSAQAAREYQPQIGQEGKDVIWVPTPQALVDKMLDMAKVGPRDFVVDLGSGDGRTVISAAQRGATALGIEYDPNMVELSKRNAAKAGGAAKATFVKADIFESDFSKATVVTLYLLPGLNLKLRPTILAMAPGTRVVSNSFDMGDWTPDEIAHVTTDCTGYCRAVLWIVPAKVEGAWRMGQSELSLAQKYQVVTGKLTTGTVIAPITDGKLVADQITFSAGGTRYTGRVQGGAMEGTSTTGGAEAKWEATRK
jgi:hypothetical protein